MFRYFGLSVECVSEIYLAKKKIFGFRWERSEFFNSAFQLAKYKRRMRNEGQLLSIAAGVSIYSSVKKFRGNFPSKILAACKSVANDETRANVFAPNIPR